MTTIEHTKLGTDTTQKTASMLSLILEAVLDFKVSLFRRAQLKRSLGSLSEKHLRDVGLTRADVLSAVETPISMDALRQLAETRAAQSDNW